MSKSIKIRRSDLIRLIKEELNSLDEGEVIDLADHPNFRGNRSYLDDNNDGDDSYVDHQMTKTSSELKSRRKSDKEWLADADDEFASFLDSLESGKVSELPDEYSD